jgi:hypothetical protein
MSEAPDTEVTRALVLTRGSLHGREAVERIAEAASRARMWVFRRSAETVSRADGTMRIDMPLVELVADAEIDGMASFEVRDGELTTFEVSSEMLRAAAP